MSYDQFYNLHHQSKPFILANAWNVKSAQLIEKVGFAAIGTSSGAIADSLGYPDGENIPFAELLHLIKRVKLSTSIPLTVDMERGYTDDLNVLNDNIQKLIDLGVSGINIEDAQGEEIFLRKLNGIKNHLQKTNQQIFINARTDGFLQKLESPLERTLKRAELYKEAGADGLFVTALKDQELIKTITAATSLPVNVVAVPGLLSTEILEECGVKRISMAVLLYKKTYASLESTAHAILADQSFTPLY